MQDLLTHLATAVELFTALYLVAGFLGFCANRPAPVIAPVVADEPRYSAELVQRCIAFLDALPPKGTPLSPLKGEDTPRTPLKGGCVPICTQKIAA